MKIYCPAMYNSLVSSYLRHVRDKHNHDYSKIAKTEKLWRSYNSSFDWDLVVIVLPPHEHE